jgi:hypothetical protein
MVPVALEELQSQSPLHSLGTLSNNFNALEVEDGSSEACLKASRTWTLGPYFAQVRGMLEYRQHNCYKALFCFNTPFASRSVLNTGILRACPHRISRR